MTSSVYKSSQEIIYFKDSKNSSSLITSTLIIEDNLNLATVYIDSSVLTKDEQFIILEPSLSPNEYFTLNEKIMNAIFFQTKIQVQNLRYKENLVGITKIGDIASSRTGEAEGLGGFVGFIPFSQSLTFIRFM